MKSPAFEYRRFADLPSLLTAKAVSGRDARILAGGQSLVPLMNLRQERPALLLDINAIAALRGVAIRGDALVIGATTTFREVLAFSEISTVSPLLAQAIPHIAYPAIRNRGTIGGNLAFADPAAELSACVLALDASVTISSQSRQRTVAATDFFLGPNLTVLGEDEVLTALTTPLRKPGAHHAFAEISRRSQDAPVCSVAIVAEPKQGPLRRLRIALGGISDRPILARKAARLIEQYGDIPSPEEFEETLRADAEIIGDARCDAATRLRFASVLSVRALRNIQNEITSGQ